jgi:hypothetical protein
MGTELMRVARDMDRMVITFLAGRGMHYSRLWMRGVILIRALRRRARRLRPRRSVLRLRLLMSRLMDVSISLRLTEEVEANEV